MKIVENKNVEINNFQKYSIAAIGAYRVFYSAKLVIIDKKELINRSQIGPVIRTESMESWKKITKIIEELLNWKRLTSTLDRFDQKQLFKEN